VSDLSLQRLKILKGLGFKTPYEVFSELTGLDGRMLAMGIR